MYTATDARTDLDTDIQRAWDGAHDLLSRTKPEQGDVLHFVHELVACSERAKLIGRAGDRELIWLANRLADLLDSEHKPSFQVA